MQGCSRFHQRHSGGQRGSSLGRTDGQTSSCCCASACVLQRSSKEQAACRALGPCVQLGCEAPGCFHRVSPSSTGGSFCHQFNKQPVGGRGAPWPPRCSGHPGEAGRSRGSPQEPGATLPAPCAGGALRGMAPASPERAAPRPRHGGPSRALPGGPRSSRPRPVSGGRPSSGTPPGGGGGRGGGGMAGVRRAR